MSGQTPSATAKRAKASGRGSKPGERRGGRQKGTPNKATASIRDIAKQYTTEAIAALVAVMRDKDEPAAARVSAANSILDRGYGKPSQPIDGDGEGGAIQIIIRKGLAGG